MRGLDVRVRQIGVHRLDLVGRDQAKSDAAVAQALKALCDVQVVGKVARLGQDHRATRSQPARRRQQLEEVDRCGIRNHHLAPSGADQARDLVAHALRRADPVVHGPASDQVLAPLPRGYLVQPRRRLARQRAERDAVQVHDAIRQHEGIAQRSQRVVAVQRFEVRQRHTGRAVPDHSRVLTFQASMTFGTFVKRRGRITFVQRIPAWSAKPLSTYLSRDCHELDETTQHKDIRAFQGRTLQLQRIGLHPGDRTG